MVRKKREEIGKDGERGREEANERVRMRERVCVRKDVWEEANERARGRESVSTRNLN